MTAKAWNDFSIRDQYPREIVKPARIKNDVNSVRSVERKTMIPPKNVLYTDGEIKPLKKASFRSDRVK